MMKKRAFFCFFMILMILLSYAFSETKTISIGDTGISFSVDSSWEVITNDNISSYPPETRELLSTYGNDAMLIQTGNGIIIVNFTTEKYYSILDSTGKNDDEIIQLFDLFYKKLETEKYLGNYSLSVYASGEEKWIKVYSESQDYYMYAIVRDNTAVVLTFTSEFTPEETEPVIDTFQF